MSALSQNRIADQVFELSRLALADRNGGVAVFQVYMDESGTHDGSETVTVAGYIGRPEDWRDWTEKWNKTLGAIKVYHAVDAQNLKGEFSNWTSAQVADLVKKLLPIIAEAKIGGIAISMDLRALEAAIKGRDDLRQLIGTPYVACLQWAMQAILNLAFKAGSDENIAFIHEENDYYAQAHESFDWIKSNSSRGSNVISLTFSGKREYPPLQAADILAYETNKRLRNINAPERRPWALLKANKFAASYGDANMGELVSALEKIKAGKSDEISRGSGWNRSWASR